MVENKKEASPNWLVSQDHGDRRMYAQLNREVKSMFARQENKSWDGKCE